jgi:hypothetical protein
MREGLEREITDFVICKGASNLFQDLHLERGVMAASYETSGIITNILNNESSPDTRTKANKINSIGNLLMGNF